MIDDQTLLAQARRLEPDALAEIHERYYGPIFRYVAFRLSNPDLAEDVTSDVFVRFLSALRDHRAPQNNLKGWLFSVAARVVADHYRQQYRHPQQPLSETAVSPDADPADIVADHLTWDRVAEAMSELTPEQQEAIALRFGEDLSIRDAAQIMGKSEGAIKQLQSRAVAMLTRRLTGTREG